MTMKVRKKTPVVKWFCVIRIPVFPSGFILARHLISQMQPSSFRRKPESMHWLEQ
jgi:hypothetical protein